jgi:hypothetical protein
MGHGVLYSDVKTIHSPFSTIKYQLIIFAASRFYRNNPLGSVTVNCFSAVSRRQRLYTEAMFVNYNANKYKISFLFIISVAFAFFSLFQTTSDLLFP